MPKFIPNVLQEVNEMKGYRSREDVFSLEKGYLVSGSKNVLTNYKDKVKIRLGYKKIGESQNLNWIATSSSTEFFTPDDNLYKPLRVIYNTSTKQYKIQFINQINSKDLVFIDLYSYGDNSKQFYEPTFAEITNILSTSTSSPSRPWSDKLQANKTYLISSNSSNGVNWWSGAVSKIVSYTSNTITLTQDAILLGFNNTGSILVNGSTYTYTGISGNQLTGVSNITNNITGYLAIQTFEYQSIQTTLQVDIISNFYNQLFIADKGKGILLASQSNTIGNFSYSLLRLAGEGIQLVSNEPITCFIPTEDFMWVSTKNTIRKISYSLNPQTITLYNSQGLPTGSQTIYYESVLLSPVKRQENYGAISQQATTHINDNICFISFEPTINSLGNIIKQQNTYTGLFNLSLIPISESIREDIIKYNFKDSSIKYWRDYLYISVPKEGLFLMYKISEQKWESPIYIPVSSFSIINNEIYGHSYFNADTYKLFTGNNDIDTPIPSIAIFSWQDYGKPLTYKNINEIFIQGKMSSNTILNVEIQIYNENGFSSIYKGSIDGKDFVDIGNYNSIGSDYLGESPVGSSNNIQESENYFFNVKLGISVNDFLQIRYIFSSFSNNQYWEVLRFGGDITESDNLAINVYK